jgi:glutamine cyclotransferase
MPTTLSIVLAAGAIIAAVLGLGAWRWGLASLLVRQSAAKHGTARWLDRGPVPLADKRYSPQGMTFLGERLFLANSWRDTRSRVYEFETESMRCLGHFDMPPDAVHTSGLAWDGERLWAVDHVSNRAYCLDVAKSLATGQAHAAGSFDTTLRGTSACCFVDWQGTRLLAISDYMRTRRTVFVRHEQALAAGTAAAAIVFSYANEGFSQGLEFAEGFLYEAENKLGGDVINRLDLAALAQTRDARRATARQFAAPGRGVEDLAWDGTAMWTSDEVVYRIYRGTFES